MTTIPLTQQAAYIKARDLQAAAKKAGRKLSYNQALVDVAKANGYSNVHEMTAQFSKQPLGAVTKPSIFMKKIGNDWHFFAADDQPPAPFLVKKPGEALTIRDINAICTKAVNFTAGEQASFLMQASTTLNNEAAVESDTILGDLLNDTSDDEANGKTDEILFSMTAPTNGRLRITIEDIQAATNDGDCLVPISFDPAKPKLDASFMFFSEPGRAKSDALLKPFDRKEPVRDRSMPLPKELEAMFSAAGLQESPDHPREAWIDCVNDGQTDLGYWAWVYIAYAQSNFESPDKNHDRGVWEYDLDAGATTLDYLPWRINRHLNPPTRHSIHGYEVIDLKLTSLQPDDVKGLRIPERFNHTALEDVTRQIEIAKSKK